MSSWRGATIRIYTRTIHSLDTNISKTPCVKIYNVNLKTELNQQLVCLWGILVSVFKVGA